MKSFDSRFDAAQSVNPRDAAASLRQRYVRATQLTAPKTAVALPGMAVEGYWIEDGLYFFLAEKFETSIGRVVGVPSIIRSQDGRIESVLSLDVAAELVSRHSGQPTDLAALSSARFDMLDRDTLVVSVGGQDYFIKCREPRVFQARASLDVAALFSPDGRYACFVKGSDLWLRETETGVERPLTHDGEPHYCYGQRAESGLSPVSYRRRPTPAGSWSADSQWFLTHRIDERALPDLALIQHAPPDGGRPVIHNFKYTMPGDPLPTATYVALHAASGRVVTFHDYPTPVVMPYLPFSQLAWFGGENAAWLLRYDRYFKQAELIRLDLQNGSGRIVLTEGVASGYLDHHSITSGRPNIRTLANTEEVIWFSERDGWGHLYLYDANTGRLKNQITRGPHPVRDIIHVDEKQRKLLLLVGGLDEKADPARRSLCSVGFDGSGFEARLSHEGDVSMPRTEPCGLFQDRPFRPARAQGGISPTGRWAVVRYGSVDRGNRTEMVDLHSRRSFSIAAALPRAVDVQARHFSALAADGETVLHGVMFLPSDFNMRRRYPLIDSIYPGPQIAWQAQSFRAINSAQARALAELGFVTIMLDTRGSPIASRAFHQVGYGGLLEPQLADHAAVVRQLCERFPFIDSNRIGMIGESGGGSATARALFDYGDVFKVGVAVCGNHDSTVYTTMWSDKYRGPDHGQGWAQQDNAAVAHKLEGKLMLISGDMDENVLVSHTLALADALTRANKDFELLIMPNEGHTVLLTNGYVQRRVWDFFVRHLLGETPPAGFELHYEPHELARMWAVQRSEALL